MTQTSPQTTQTTPETTPKKGENTEDRYWIGVLFGTVFGAILGFWVSEIVQSKIARSQFLRDAEREIMRRGHGGRPYIDVEGRDL